MIARNITSRDMLRLLTCEQLLGCSRLTPDMRYAQAVAAQQLRNFFFTATLQPYSVAFLFPGGTRLLARTPIFADPLLVTEIISLYDMEQSLSQQFLSLEVLEYGGQERSVGLDHFGLSGYVPQRYLISHEKNRSVQAASGTGLASFDLQSRFVGYVPRLLAPGQQLEFDWTNIVTAAHIEAPSTTRLFLQAGLRAVRALLPDNPYAKFSTIADRQICDYIKGSSPETFFLEARLEFADFPAAGATVTIKTPQMDRPLLVLGASSNLEGAQAELRDESEYYTFTFADVPITQVPGVALYNAPPLALWASNSDLRNISTYNMFPVPHLLERGAQLIIKLTNGLTPNNTVGGFAETMLTRGEQAARIVFLCRTV